MHSKNIADHYYDKPLLKDKAHSILTTYEKLWNYATTKKESDENDYENPAKYHKKNE